MTDEEINELWCTHGPHEVMGSQPGTKVHDFALALIAAERERCSRIAEEEECDQTEYWCQTAERIAKQIRHD